MSLKLKSSGDNRTVSTIQSCIPRKIANTSRETGQRLRTVSGQCADWKIIRSRTFSHDEKSPTRERIVDIGSYLVVVS
jgi:hypothetical protein